MRVNGSTDMSREECLGRALEHEWMAENCLNLRSAVYNYDRARQWRSLSYVAKRVDLAEKK